MRKVRVVEISTKYAVISGDHKINAEVFSSGGISLSTNARDEEFIFNNSDPEMIEIIANLMLAIAKHKK